MDKIEMDSIQVNDFMSEIYRASFLSERYKPFNDFSGFIKDKNSVSLFNLDDIDDWVDKYPKIKVYSLLPEQYKKWKAQAKIENTKFNYMKANITILKFDPDYFKLEGKKFKKLRYYRNYFTKKVPIEIRKEPNSIDEVVSFIREWKEIRKGAHFQFFIGYDINFIKNYYAKWKDRLVARFFYHENRLVGYFIMERVNKHLYNQLYRKVNTNYSHLSLYCDLINFQTISNQINEPFLVNMEGDVGEDGLKKYKTENFPVFKVFETYDIKINNTNQQKTKKLF